MYIGQIKLKKRAKEDTRILEAMPDSRARKGELPDRPVTSCARKERQCSENNGGVSKGHGR